jgi:predicted TIM-barrel fold metal-dependent hydrolase
MPGADHVERLADSHHHLWDLGLNRYPWLQGEPEDPADPSGVGMLQRNYLVQDLLGDTGGLPLIASVHVEAAHDPADPVRETSWLQSLTDTLGFPTAIVAAAALEAADISEVLAAHCEHSAVKGIRQMLDRNPVSGASEETALLEDSKWRRGFALLAPLALSFDLQVLPSQLAAAARLAADFHETTFVLNHGGYHVRASPEQRELWRTGIALLARQPNVVVKLSGYDAVDPTWTVGGYTEFVWTLLETFGVDRVLFGSNFPVDRRTITYAVLVAATLALTWQLTADERDRLFYRNTVRTYRINGPITNQTLRVWGLR